MHTTLFSNLKAFLAPTVPSTARAAWTENGGVLATKADASSANSKIDVFVGVRGAEDVLVARYALSARFERNDVDTPRFFPARRLRALGFEVVDVKWMWDSLRQEKLLKKEPYSLERESSLAKEGAPLFLFLPSFTH